MITHEEAVARRIEEENLTHEDCLARASRMLMVAREICEYDGCVDKEDFNVYVERGIAWLESARKGGK